MTMTIDAHMHVWTVERGWYGWLDEAPETIRRDFAIDDIWTTADAVGIEKALLVQAAPDLAESEFLLDIAARDARLAGVVGWIDFEARDWEGQLRRLSGRTGLKGLRPMIGDLADPEWILNSAFGPVFEAMARHSLVLDLHAKPQHLRPAERIAARHPDLQLVLDHGGKPALASGGLGSWTTDLAALAQHDNVTCKLSGLLTECGPQTRREEIEAAARHIFDCFGADRVLWGSDWPVLELAGEYGNWMQLSRELVARFAGEDEDKIFRENARRIYAIE